MSAIRLTEDNLEKYERYLEPDPREDLRREGFGSLIVTDVTGSSVEAFLIWMLKEMGEKYFTEFVWFSPGNKEEA